MLGKQKELRRIAKKVLKFDKFDKTKQQRRYR